MIYRLPVRFTELEAARRMLQEDYNEIMQILHPSWWALFTGKATRHTFSREEVEALESDLNLIQKAIVDVDTKLLDQGKNILHAHDADYPG